jgi:hypothetical protein
MGKHKHQNRELGQAADGVEPGEDQDQKKTKVMAQNDGMPSMSPNMSRKRGKKFGHN